MSIIRRAGGRILKVLQQLVDPAGITGQAQLYAKDVSGTAQLFAVDGAGTAHQLTPAGGVSPVVYDTGSVAFTNIKASRPAGDASTTDATKAGITNLGAGSSASNDYAAIGGGFGNTVAGSGATVPGGYNNNAQGDASFASGDGSTALGYAATAMNQSDAKADYSFAENFGFVDVGASASHAEGSGFVDDNCVQSHAEGRNTYIWPNVRGGHVEGNFSEVKFDSGHAEGDSCVAGNYYAHAEGVSCHAMGSESHAEGNTCYANGRYSHAQGGATTADGEGAHSEGDGTYAVGKWSHAQGSASKALRETQFAFSSGSTNYSSARGAYQTSWLTVRGTTGGGSTNEAVDLKYGITSDLSDIALEDGKAYSFKVIAVCGGTQAGPVRVSRTIEIKFNARRDGGVTTITGSGATDAYGDATTSTWALTPTVGTGPDRLVLTFDTGAGPASACGVCARVEFAEVAY